MGKFKNKILLFIKKVLQCRHCYNDLCELVTHKSSWPEKYSYCYYSFYIGQQTSTPPWQNLCKKSGKKICLPSIASYVRNWVREFEVCMQNKQISGTRMTPETVHVPEKVVGPEGFVQINLLPEAPPGGCMDNVISTTDIFSRYTIADPVSETPAVNTAKVVLEIMT